VQKAVTISLVGHTNKWKLILSKFLAFVGFNLVIERKFDEAVIPQYGRALEKSLSQFSK
jgi:hypothetical protein